MEPTSIIWLYALASVFIVSLLSLIGIAFISMREAKLKQIIFAMVSLAVGGLFGDAFIHLLPEFFEQFQNKLEALSIFSPGSLSFLFWRSFFSGGISMSSKPIVPSISSAI